MVVVRGDHRVNEIKLAQRARRSRSGPRATEEIARADRPAGLHRPGRRGRRRCCSTRRSRAGGYVAGANQPDTPPARRRARPRLRVRARRRAHASRPATRSAATRSAIEPAIEVGNIFKLGTRYSEPLGATYLDENGKRAADLDGLLRHRAGAHRRRRRRAVRRRAAGSRGRRRSRRGDVELVALGKPGTPEREAAEALYARAARGRASTSLLDDRDAGPGEKFADAELLGCPLRLTVGKRSLEAGRGRGAGAPRARPTSRAASRWRAAPSRRCRRAACARAHAVSAARRRAHVPAAGPASTAPARRRRETLRRRAAGTRGRSPTRSASSGSR